MITAANESIQDPAKVGNGLKSLAMNFSGMKANAKDGSLEMNKTAKALQNIAGIDVMKDHKTGELKDMVTILDEVHDKWGDLTDAQQKGLSEAIAGKHQAAIFQSLMGNYETFKKMRNEFDSGMHFGSAERENEQYLNSLAGKLNKLKTTSMDTFTTLFNSSEAYSFLDVVNKVAEGINKVTHGLSDMHMISPALGGIIGGIKGFKNFKNQLELKTAKEGLINSLKSISGADGISKEMSSTGNIIQSNARQTIKFSDAVKNLGAGLKESGQASIGIWKNSEKGISGAKTALSGFKNLSKDTFKDFAKSSAVSLAGGFKDVMAGAASGLAIGAVMSVAQIGISKVSDYMNRHQIAYDEKLDKQQSLQQSISDLKTQQAGIKELSSEYDNLAKKTNKTAEETQRFSELKNQIAQIAPDLKIGTDQNNDPILRMSGSAEGYGKILQRDIDLKEQLLGMNQGSLANEAYEIAKKSMSDFKDDFRAVDRVRDVFEGNQKSFDFLFGGSSDFGTMLRKHNIRKAAEDFEVARASAQERYEQMSMLNAEMSKDAITKLQNPNMYKNYAFATDAIKDQINAFASGKINWSNLGKTTDRSKAIGLLDKMALASKKGTLNMSSLNRELEDMQENFNASGNEKVYEKRLDGVSETIAKATGEHKDFVKEMLRTPRYNMDWDTQNLAKYMESQGVKYTNLGSKDEKVRANARNIKAQYESLKGIWDSLSGSEDITTEFTASILMDRNIPPDLKGLADRFLLDGEIDDTEAEILYNIGLAYENGMPPESIKELIEEGEAKRNKGNNTYKPKATPINEIFKDMSKGIKDLISGKALEDLSSWIDNIAPSMEESLNNFSDKFHNRFVDAISPKSLFGDFGSGQKPEAIDIFGNIYDWLGNVDAWGIEIGNKITEKLNNVKKSISTSVKDFLADLFSLDNVFGEGGSSQKPEAMDIGAVLDGWLEGIDTWGNEAGAKIEAKLNEVSQSVQEAITGFLADFNLMEFLGDALKSGWEDSWGGLFSDLMNSIFPSASAAEINWDKGAVSKVAKDMAKPEKITKKWEIENIVENDKMPTDLRKFGRASIADGEISKVEKRVQVALVREYQEKGGLDEATQKALSQLEQIQLGNVAPTEIKAPIKIAGEVVSVEDLKQMAEEAMQKKEMGELEYHALIKTLAEVEGDSSVGQKVEDTVKGETEGVEYEATPTVNVKPKTEGSGLKDFLGKIFGQESFLGEGNTISVDADTGSASGKLSQLLGQAKQLLGKTFHMSIIAHTSHAYAKVKAFANQVKHLTGKTFHVSIIAHTSHAYSKIKAFTSKIKGLSKKTFHMSLIAHTAGAYAKINASLSKAKQWAGKTFHASFIAHTAHAHSKISALLSKARQWNGHTFHASFIAHTAHAYAKVSSLLSLAQSFGGRTFHASMTVTRTINTVHSGKAPGKGATTRSLPEPRTLNEQASTPMMASDTPTVLADGQPSIKPVVRTGASRPALFDLPYTGSGSIQDAIGGINNSIGDSLKDVENKVIQTIHGIQSKAISLADAVKKGTIVTLTPIAKTVKDILDCLKFDIDRLKELENAIKKVSNVIDYTDKRLQHSVGSGRIALLQKENDLLVERLKLNEQMIAQKKRERDIYKAELQKKGFKFGVDGNPLNYEEMMLKYKRELEKLEKAEDKASDSSSKNNEKRKKEIEELIKMMEKFLELVFTEIPDLDAQKLDDSNKYQDNLLEIKKIEHEKWVVEMESHWKEVNKEVQKLTNQLDMLDVKMKHAWGSDKLQMMNQQIDLLKQSQGAYQNNLNALKHAQGEIQSKLQGYGFTFKANGDIDNFVATMNKLKDTSEEFDTIQKLVDGYFQVYLEDIPKAERELADFQNKIKDVYKEQLEATKALEDQIIEMYKKELEEKKKMIDEELEHKLDALDKEKKAYDRMREDQKYKDDFNEQADKIKELEKQIEYAKKDTTLTGQKRLKGLLKELEEAQKKLDEITQNRIDQQVGDSFDDEKDRLENNAETEKEDLDDKYSDEEMLKKAQEAIKNGLFVGIDGEVQSLQEALVKYVNKWGDGLSATGVLIKSELITKLEIATQIAKEYGDVINGLDMGILDQNQIYGKGGNSNRIPEKADRSNAINYNAPLVNITGDVTDNNIGQIREIAESVVRENNQRILDNI